MFTVPGAIVAAVIVAWGLSSFLVTTPEGHVLIKIILGSNGRPA